MPIATSLAMVSRERMRRLVSMGDRPHAVGVMALREKTLLNESSHAGSFAAITCHPSYGGRMRASVRERT
jgi:hypothetical protein